MEKLFTGYAEHPRPRLRYYQRQEARVPRDPNMGGSKRGKVYWFDRIEEITGMKDSKEIAGN